MLSRILLLSLISGVLLEKWMSYIASEINYYGMDPINSEMRWIVGTGAIFLTIVSTAAIRGKLFWVVFAFWIFFVLPNSLTFMLFDVDPIFLFATTFSALIVSGALIFAANNGRAPATTEGRYPVQTRTQNVARIMYFGFAFSLFYFFLIHRFDINYQAIFLTDIYDWRWEITGERSGLENRLFSWATKSFMFSALVLSITTKRYIMLGVTTIGALYLFSTSGQKSIVFWAVAVGFFVMAAEGNLPILRRKWSIALIVTALASYPPIELGFDNFVVRRMLFLPTYLNEAYLQTFPEPLFLAHSIFNGVFSFYKFDVAPAYLVGREYWGFYVSLNNGVVSDGYINFGFFGALLFPIIALSLCIFVARRLDGAYFVIVIPYVWQFNNSALITTLFGHGFVFLVFWALANSRLRHQPRGMMTTVN